MSLAVRKSEAFLADLDAPDLVSSGDAMFGPAGVLAPSRVRAEPSPCLEAKRRARKRNQPPASGAQALPARFPVRTQEHTRSRVPPSSILYPLWLRLCLFAPLR